MRIFVRIILCQRDYHVSTAISVQNKHISGKEERKTKSTHASCDGMFTCGEYR